MTELNIPTVLKDWRFILIQPKGKKPIAEMKGWADNRETITLTYDSPVLRGHFEKGGNYAVITGTDRFVLAADTKEVEQAIEQRLPKTFSVKSPRHQTKHFYFYGSISKFIEFKPSIAGDPCCDLKRGNAYVLGPYSIFEKYGAYEVIDDLPIATITEEQVIAALSEFFKKVSDKSPITEILEDAENKLDPKLNFSIEKIIPNLNCMSTYDDIITGPHPTHGSDTGSNFRADIKKNIWHCFREGHNSGGGALSLLAVIEGILNCEECHKGALRGEKFWKAVERAQELGLIAKDYQPTSTPTDNKFILVDPKTKERSIKSEVVLKELRTQFIFKTPTDIEELYYYSDGIYKPAESKIKGLLEKWLGILATTYFIKEMLGHLERGSYIDREEFNKYNGYVPVLNGLLHLATGKLEPFTATQIFTYKINAEYKPSAKCPKFLRFLTDTLETEDILTLQEYTGYTLYPSMPFHKSMWFLGGGRNGKGTFTRTIEAILGGDHVAHIDITRLNGERTFVEHNFYGKLVNISSEPTTKQELETPLFKKLTGGDWIDAEYKNKQKPVRFQSFAKFFILGNKYPKVNDDTVAFWERVLLLKFNGTFLEGQGQIQDIEKNWLTNPEEVSGILNWMIEGLHRLIVNGKFTVSKTQANTKLEFKRASDPFSAWLEESTTIGKDYYIPRTAAYDDYKTYCDNNNLDNDTDKKFYARMRQVPKIKDVQTTRKGETEKRFWLGICLNKDLERQESIVKAKNAQQTLENTTDTTDTTHFSGSNKKEQKRVIKNEQETSVVSAVSVVNQDPQTPTLEESDVSGYNQLACFFCGKGIMDNDWVQDDFSGNKPAHKRCYDEKREQLVRQDEREAS